MALNKDDIVWRGLESFGIVFPIRYYLPTPVSATYSLIRIALMGFRSLASGDTSLFIA